MYQGIVSLSRLLRQRLGSPPQPVDQEIDHRRRVKRQDLRDEQSADDGDAERPAQLGAGTGCKNPWYACEQRGDGGHQNGTKPRAARLENRIRRGKPAVALGVQREVDDHDSVLLDNADQENNADERDDRERRIGRRSTVVYT